MKKKKYEKPMMVVYVMETASTLLATSDIEQTLPNGYCIEWEEEEDGLWGE